MSKKSVAAGDPDWFAPTPGAAADAPLSARFRPRILDEFAGQSHLLAPGKLLRRAIESDRFSSLLFSGPPGTGKTSLALLIAELTHCHFEKINAVESGTAEVRKAIATASNRLANTGRRTVLFIDELHRFNKAQQDLLLPDVESGLVRLIGATTMNPFFYVNAPLVSRSQVFILEPVSPEELAKLLRRVLADTSRGLGSLPLEVEDAALQHLSTLADGDARRALNSLEVAALTTPPDATGRIRVSLAVAEECIQKKAVVYDGDGDAHYDTISAFIKSVRGSEPDAALYWLAKMLHAGEDIRFIARRLVILASEDIGMADPRGIMVAVAAQQAVEFIGMPEARIPLAEATVYLATAPKSNAAYKAMDAALEEVRRGVTVPVPKSLRDGHYAGAEKLGHGEGYEYAHDHPGAIAPLMSPMLDGRYYHPTQHGYEKNIADRLEAWRQTRGARSPDAT